MEASDTAQAPLAPPAPNVDLLTLDYSPSTKDVLAVAWIGGHFECAATRKGKVVSLLISHEDCFSSDAFDTYIDQAIDSLSFQGTKAELLIDSGVLDTSNITLPPVKPRQQISFIKEKVRRMQEASGPLIWESQTIAASKNGQRALIHSLSKESFNQFEKQFVTHGIELKKVLPFMGTASRPFRDIQTPAGSASIVLAPVGTSYKILGLDHAGNLQFARDLVQQGRIEPQRVAVEINRCILFTRQQFGKPVSQIVTVGLQAARFKTVIAKLLQGEVPIIHRKTSQDLWLSELIHSRALNLAKESMVQDRKARIQRTSVSVVSLLACIGLLTTAVSIKSEYDLQQIRFATLEENETEMEATIAASKVLTDKVEEMENFTNAVSNLKRPPLEKALITFLANNLPEDTWISEIETNWKAEENAWSLRLLMLCNGDKATSDRRREKILTDLKASPFGLQVPTTISDRVRAISSRGQSSGTQTILIDGTIQLNRSPLLSQ